VSMLIALGLSAALVSVGATQEEESFLRIPPKEEILKTLRPDHPRVLLRPDSFDKVRTAIQADRLLARWHADVIEQANAILKEPPSEYVIPDGKRLLATSRRVRDRVLALAYAYHMTGDAKYRDRAWAELQAAAAFKDWNPRHFLDTGEMTCALGIGYDWLYDAWTPEQRSVLEAAIVKHGFGPALRSYRREEDYGWWVRADHNWNQVCNGGLAVGALAIADRQPEAAAEILREGLLSLRLAMRCFAPDGGWAEGPGYWNYATIYNVLHLAALDTALGDDFGFSRYPGFSRTGEFPIYVCGPTATSFNYADGSAGTLRPAQMFWLAERFNRPDFGAYERQAGRASVLDLIWAAELGQAKDVKSPPLDRHFEAINVVTMRSAWDDRDALFIGLQAGDNRVNHSHLDLGSFVFDALGERWVADLGADNYNMPGYFGNKRWTYYRLRAEGHNTIVLAPGPGPDQNERAKGKITRFDSKPERAFAVADLTQAYGEHAKRVMRGIVLLDGRRQVLVQDEVSPKDGSPVEMWSFLHTAAEIEVTAEDPSRAILRIGDKRVQARILSPAGASFTVMDAGPLPSSPNPEEQNQNKGYRKLAIRLTVQGDTTLAVLLTPLRPSAGPIDPPRVVPLSQW
jgi:hypothetical protein